MKNQNRLISTPYVGQMLIIKNALNINGRNEGNPSHLSYYKINGINLEEIQDLSFVGLRDLLINKDGSGGGEAIIEAAIDNGTVITVPSRKRPNGGRLELTLQIYPEKYNKTYEVSASRIVLGRLAIMESSSGGFTDFRLLANEKQYTCESVFIQSDYIFNNMEYLKEFVNSLPNTGTLEMDSSLETYNATRDLFIEHGWDVIEPVAEAVEE